MEKIEIEHFKGYKNLATVSLQKHNLLLFGENGAGKSSLYEAIKHFFFFIPKIEPSLLPASATTEDRKQAVGDYIDKLRFSGDPVPPSVKINGLDQSIFPRSDYFVFLISPEELQTRNEILLSDMTAEWFFDGNPQVVMETIWEELQEAINDTLRNVFREKLKIRIEKADGYRCILEDEKTGFSYGNDLKKYFNESRLHLVQLLLLLEVAQLSYDKGKKNILVLDDFVTSLDAANRAFIISYILERFKAFQVLVMTHSVGFYNLFRYEINLILPPPWQFWCVYSASETCKFYNDDKKIATFDLSTVSDSDPAALETVGNQIRRCFEETVHRLCRHLLIGGKEESHQLLSYLYASKTYFRNGKKGPEGILSDILNLVSNDHYKETELGKKIMEKLIRWRVDLSMLQQSLKRMELFQKIALHPSSHGADYRLPVHKKELEESSLILVELQTIVKQLDCHAHEEALF